MRFPEGFIASIKESCDIVSIVSSYVELKRSGRDHVCCCPFHLEKTPSCHIYTQTQSFYCFGCGAGGDVITFIELIERLPYLDSVKLLADRAGIPMPEDEVDEGVNKRVRMLAMNREAARYFRDVLISPQGAEGLDYLYSRGLKKSTIVRYGLGFAPDGWHNLHFYLRKLGYTDDEMIAGALLVKNNNSAYDKFRRRVMFPIIDKRGNVIGFGGRTLEKDAKAKYLNSDETLVFRKRENIFSINFAKNTKEDFLILCEGYMDVITLNQAGFDSAVATLGTAITPQQANLMKGNAKEVIISYDSDAAGQKAALRAINLFAEAGLKARVLKIPDAKDPDEYIKKFGAESFRQILGKSEGALDYEFRRLYGGNEPRTAEERTEFLKKAVIFLADINNRTEQTVYISEAAKLSQQQSSVVRELVEDRMRYNKRAKVREEENKLINSAVQRDPINPDAVRFPAEEKAERGIIAFLFHSPDHLPRIEKSLSPQDFPTEFNRRVYEFVSQRIRDGDNIDLSVLGDDFTAEEKGRIAGICRQADELPYSLQRLDGYIERLVRAREEGCAKPPEEMTEEEMQREIEEMKRRLSDKKRH